MNCLAIDPADFLRIVQASVAPVVLISGVGLLLLTLSNRLGRIVDRTRAVAHERLQHEKGSGRRAGLDVQLTILSRRAKLIRLALALCATSVGLIGVLITTLFFGLLMDWNVTVPCAVLFVSALAAVVMAMVHFTRELFDALRALDLSIEQSEP